MQARVDNGLATRPELLQAQQQTAQSAFDVEATAGVESDARVALGREHRPVADRAAKSRGPRTKIDIGSSERFGR